MIKPHFVDANCDVCGCPDTRQRLGVCDTAYHECSRCPTIYARPTPTNYVALNDCGFAERVGTYIANVYLLGCALQ